MAKKKYIVTLTEDERKMLLNVISTGKRKAKTITHAQILLRADINNGKPKLSDKAIAEMFHVGTATIERIRRTFVEEGFEIALNGRHGEYVRIPKIDGEKEAKLIALTCSEAPEGYESWTLRLLADKLVELEIVDSISHETVRKVLKKMNSSRGKKRCGVSRQKKMQNLSAIWKTS